MSRGPSTNAWTTSPGLRNKMVAPTLSRASAGGAGVALPRPSGRPPDVPSPHPWAVPRGGEGRGATGGGGAAEEAGGADEQDDHHGGPRTDRQSPATGAVRLRRAP